jgi:hypothetical protein
MEMRSEEWSAGQDYLANFDVLIGDKRTGRTFRGIIHGIIGGESLRASVIARFSPRDGSGPAR